MVEVLQLSFLGGYRAQMAGAAAPIDFPTKKSALLLPVIVLERPPPSRDRLASLLWSDRQEQQGRGSLRQAIFTLRATLRQEGAPELGSAQDSVSLPSDFVSCDAVLFRNLANQNTETALEQAQALYKGPFLGTVRLPDPEFARWAEDQRRALSDLAETIGIRLGLLKKSQGKFQEAIENMQWVLAMDPLREDVHRHLMELNVTERQQDQRLAAVSALPRPVGARIGGNAGHGDDGALSGDFGKPHRRCSAAVPGRGQRHDRRTARGCAHRQRVRQPRVARRGQPPK